MGRFWRTPARGSAVKRVEHRDECGVTAQRQAGHPRALTARLHEGDAPRCVAFRCAARALPEPRAGRALLGNLRSGKVLFAHPAVGQVASREARIVVEV
jgi:hypothetical protein